MNEEIQNQNGKPFNISVSKVVFNFKSKKCILKF